jgi:hypothetical protein
MSFWPRALVSGPQISINSIIWATFCQKPKEKWSKYRFFLKFWIQFGPHKNVSGPQVGRPWLRPSHEIRLNLNTKSFNASDTARKPVKKCSHIALNFTRCFIFMACSHCNIPDSISKLSLASLAVGGQTDLMIAVLIFYFYFFCYCDNGF